MLTIKEVKCILRDYNIRPTKMLGQSFLIDRNIQKKMIDALKLKKEDIVLEIGPGLGALTGELCRQSGKVIAIEKDRRLYRFLQDNSFHNLNLIHGDILKYDFNNRTKIKVIGNLPYYISGPVLSYLIEKRDFIDTIFITVQKEFAERLIAGVGSKSYSAISCFVQFYTSPSRLFNIKRSIFYPAPKVDSCFLKIAVRDNALYLTDEEKLFKIIRASFGKRRKMIVNSLYDSDVFASKEDVLNRLNRTGISPTRRPETLSLEEFVRLVNGYNKRYS